MARVFKASYGDSDVLGIITDAYIKNIIDSTYVEGIIDQSYIEGLVDASYAPIDARARLAASAYPNLAKYKTQAAMVGSTTSVERFLNPSFAFSGGTATQLYSVDTVDAWHTGHTGTGASAQAGWVSGLLSTRLEWLVHLNIRFRYDSLSMSDNHRCYHGLSFGTPAYSTPATDFNSAFACVTALGGTDTNWQLRTRTGSGSVTTVDTGVAVTQGVVYDVHFRYSGGSIYAQMSADGGAWSSEVSTSSNLPTAQTLRVVSYSRVSSPSVQVELGNSAWCLVTSPGGV